MEICKYQECTGCFACANACPKGCIDVIEDNYGELHPHINLYECINCGTCIKACPSNIEISNNFPKDCYAGWIVDGKKRSICASGGVATALSEYVIKNLHGVVFGAAYDDDLVPHTTCIETVEGLEKLKGSKYVQCIVGNDVYRKMKRFIEAGRAVLFISTPCQIAAAKMYVGSANNLFLVDLICHGVSPTRYFRDEINYLRIKYNLHDINDIRFRGNDKNNYVLSIWRRDGENQERVFKATTTNDYYLSSFLLGISLRESCYSCKYSRPERISDLTIGDFIGLGRKIPFNYDATNVSSVFVNTQKGNDLYEEMLAVQPDFVSVKRSVEERLEYAPSLRHPFKRHRLNQRFRELFKASDDYCSSIRKTMKIEVCKRILVKILNSWTYIYRVPRKIYRIIKYYMKSQY